MTWVKAWLVGRYYFIYCKDRSSQQRCSVKTGALGNFAKFTEKYLCQSLFLNKVAGLRPAILLKKRLRHRCFPVNFSKFVRTPTPPADCFWKELEHASKHYSFKCFSNFRSKKMLNKIFLDLLTAFIVLWNHICAFPFKRKYPNFKAFSKNL